MGQPVSSFNGEGLGASIKWLRDMESISLATEKTGQPMKEISILSLSGATAGFLRLENKS